MKISMNHKTLLKVVTLSIFTMIMSLGLFSCFKKNATNGQSSMSEISFTAPTLEGVTWNKVKFSAKPSSSEANKDKDCQKASIPTAGEWQNFQGAVPTIDVKLTADCEYDFILGFGGSKGDKDVVYEGSSTQVVKKNADGNAEVSIDITEKGGSEPIKVDGTETGTKPDDKETGSSKSKIEKTIKIKKVKTSKTKN